MALTVAGLENARKKHKRGDKPRKLSDSHGLYCLLHKNGGMYWRVKYTRASTGKESTLAFGCYPEVTLKEARERLDEARMLLRRNVDPDASAKQAKRIASGAETFEVVARDWFKKFSAKCKPSHSSKVFRRLEKYAFPAIGRREFRDIAPRDVLEFLEPIESRGKHETAHRALQASGQVFRYAVCFTGTAVPGSALCEGQ